MGLPICANLAAAGYQVAATDAWPGRAAAVRASGAEWRGMPAAVAADAEVLITVLPGPGELRELMAAPAGVLASLPAGCIWIDMTTSSPAVGRELAAAARARGIDVLDAPAGGGPAAAQAGTLQLFVGGDAPLVERCRPLLEVLAAPGRITHTGGNGTGYLTKLLANLLWFGQALATAEALLVARRAGMNLDVLRHALAASAASSVFIREHLGSLLAGDYLTSFKLDRCCEELDTVAEIARSLGLSAELTELVARTHHQALRRYGPAGGELLAVALLEEEAGATLRHGPP
jgi:3-hydroxyisobutyrate dehydrogenase